MLTFVCIVFQRTGKEGWDCTSCDWWKAQDVRIKGEGGVGILWFILLEFMDKYVAHGVWKKYGTLFTNIMTNAV